MPVEVIFDAGPLISACQHEARQKVVIDLLTPHLSIVLPAAVYQEVTVAGARYPDAAVARQRIDAGIMTVERPQPNSELTEILTIYSLGRGESEAILLAVEKAAQGADTTLIVDDVLAYMVCDRLQVKKLLFLDLLVRLTKEHLMNVEEGKDIVQSVQSRYPKAFVAHTLRMLAKG